MPHFRLPSGEPWTAGPNNFDRQFESGCGQWSMFLDFRQKQDVRGTRSGDRVPEVVIKVSSAGSNTLKAIRIHFEDLQNGRNRILEMDTFSTPVVGKRAAWALIDNWDLDLDELYWH